MQNNKILIVDDDKNIVELITLYLEQDGYQTLSANTGASGLRLFKSFVPDLIILDVMIPEINGYEVLKQIRKESMIPIIMLTAKGEVFDKVIGLEFGADDYIVKPFDSRELVARVKALLRRMNYKMEADTENVKEILIIDNLKIDKHSYTVTYNGNIVELPPKELEILYFLAKNPRQLFTREQLLDKIWGYDYIGDTRTVDVHIKRLRDKLEGDNKWTIKTVWGKGYKFED